MLTFIYFVINVLSCSFTECIIMLESDATRLAIASSRQLYGVTVPERAFSVLDFDIMAG
jgi:hypothetical protein